MSDPIERRIVYDVDDAAINKSKQRIRELENTEKSLREEFIKGDKTFDEYRKGLSKVQAEARELNRVLDDLEQPRRIDINTDRFDAVSRDVALAGDVQSNLGALSGLAGTAGAGGIASGLGVAGELVVLTEELPRLKTALAGLPDAARAAINAIGVGGLIAGAGLAAALIGLSIVIDKVKESIDKAKASEEARTDAILNFDEFARQGGTTAQAQDLINQAELDQEALQRNIDNLTERRETIREAILIGLSGDPFERNDILESLGLDPNITGIQLDGVLSALKGDINDLSSDYQEQSEIIIQYREGIESGVLATNDAAQAEAELAQAREQSALQSASNARTLAQAQNQADELLADGLADRIDALQDTRSEAQAELNALKAQAEQTEAVTNRIEALTREIGLLDDQIGIFEAERPEAQARTDALEAQKQALEDAKEAERDREQALKDAEKASQEAIRQQERLTEAEQALADKREDLRIDEQRERLDLEINYYDDLEKIMRDSIRDRLQLEKDIGREREDLSESGDVFGLKQLSKDAERRREDLREELAIERDERRDAYDLQQRDLERNLSRQRVDLNRNYERQLRDLGAITSTSFLRINSDARRAMLQFERIIQQGLNNALGTNGTSANNGANFNEQVFATSSRIRG